VDHPLCSQPSGSRQAIFLSYAHVDNTDIARALARDLSTVGFRVNADWELLHGLSWSKQLEEALDQSDVVVALLSRASVNSHFCRSEHIRALRKDKRIVPVQIAGNLEPPLSDTEIRPAVL
jgi:hypothetical protein